jgi:RNA polymerase-binding transcription factor DksA
MALSAEQRTQIEQRLREERTRTLQTLRGLEASQSDTVQDEAGDLTKMPFHPADLGTDTMDSELDASNVTRTSRELADIDDALDRLYRTPEKFGITDDGKEIPFERLVVIPWARTAD